MRFQVFLGRPTPKRLLFRTWLNTAFVSVGSYTLRAWELDKVRSGRSPVPAATSSRGCCARQPACSCTGGASYASQPDHSPILFLADRGLLQ